MEEITIIQGDSSDIYQFSSAEVATLDTNWTANYNVLAVLGDQSSMLLSGNLDKSVDEAYFIFQLLPADTEQLDVGKYYLSIQIQQDNGSGTLLFRKEVMQAKLIITKQGVFE